MTEVIHARYHCPRNKYCTIQRRRRRWWTFLVL